MSKMTTDWFIESFVVDFMKFDKKSQNPPELYGHCDMSDHKILLLLLRLATKV